MYEYIHIFMYICTYIYMYTIIQREREREREREKGVRLMVRLLVFGWSVWLVILLAQPFLCCFVFAGCTEHSTNGREASSVGWPMAPLGWLRPLSQPPRLAFREYWRIFVKNEKVSCLNKVREYLRNMRFPKFVNTKVFDVWKSYVYQTRSAC